jgi:hypothetical protein
MVFVDLGLLVVARARISGVTCGLYLAAEVVGFFWVVGIRTAPLSHPSLWRCCDMQSVIPVVPSRLRRQLCCIGKGGGIRFCQNAASPIG